MKLQQSVGTSRHAKVVAAKVVAAKVVAAMAVAVAVFATFHATTSSASALQRANATSSLQLRTPELRTPELRTPELQKSAIKLKALGTTWGATKRDCIVNSPDTVRGVRLRVWAYFDVTNASDGLGDRNVEVYGSVSFGGRNVWRVARDNAITVLDQPTPVPGMGTTGAQDNHVNLGSQTFSVIFATRSTWNIAVTGYMNDRDKASSDDAMWNPLKLPQIVNLKQLYDNMQAGRGGGLTLKGDRHKENADLVIGIAKVGDIKY